MLHCCSNQNWLNRLKATYRLWIPKLKVVKFVLVSFIVLALFIHLFHHQVIFKSLSLHKLYLILYYYHITPFHHQHQRINEAFWTQSTLFACEISYIYIFTAHQLFQYHHLSFIAAFTCRFWYKNCSVGSVCYSVQHFASHRKNWRPAERKDHIARSESTQLSVQVRAKCMQSWFLTSQ